MLQDSPLRPISLAVQKMGKVNLKFSFRKHTQKRLSAYGKLFNTFPSSAASFLCWTKEKGDDVVDFTLCSTETCYTVGEGESYTVVSSQLREVSKFTFHSKDILTSVPTACSSTPKISLYYLTCSVPVGRILSRRRVTLELPQFTLPRFIKLPRRCGGDGHCTGIWTVPADS